MTDQFAQQLDRHVPAPRVRFQLLRIDLSDGKIPSFGGCKDQTAGSGSRFHVEIFVQAHTYRGRHTEQPEDGLPVRTVRAGRNAERWTDAGIVARQ